MQPAGRRPVVDVALQGGRAVSRRRASRAPRFSTACASATSSSATSRARAAIAVLVILGGVIVSLIIGSLPALQAFGFNFLIDGDAGIR